MDQTEQFLFCPCCGARISMLLDTSVVGQTMIEDCEVCCRPLEVRYAVRDGQVVEFNARPAQ